MCIDIHDASSREIGPLTHYVQLELVAVYRKLFTASYMCLLCAGEPAQFTLQFRPSRNFPLDVYFLLDLTGSFSQRFRDTVTPLATDLGLSLSLTQSSPHNTHTLYLLFLTLYLSSYFTLATLQPISWIIVIHRCFACH